MWSHIIDKGKKSGMGQETFRAIVCRELGPPEKLQVAEIEVGPLAADDVRVRIRAAAINFPDILMAAGQYQFKPELPFTPGMEGAGDIIAVGKNVIDWQVADKVIVKKRFGVFAEQVDLPAADVRPIPSPFDYDEAAAFSVAYFTALHCLTVRGKLKEEETLLVHGATGGVGMAAVEVGKMLGAMVIATGGSDEKLAVVKAFGADHVINYQNEDIRDTVNALTNGDGANVIYDPVGGKAFEQSLRCIAWGGRILVIGFTSGEHAKLPANYALLKGCSVIGCRAGEFGRHYPDVHDRTITELSQLAEDGAFHPHISHRIPFPNIVEACDVLRDRRVIGRAVMTFEEGA
jgi:NADPH2:quinone reductase